MGVSLSRVLRPDSVAVIGASRDPTRRGHQAVRALLDAGYAGPILPVHPAGGELLGLPVHTSVAGLPVVPDLALVGVGAGRVLEAVEECARAGVGGVIVLAVGFGETGHEGAALEQQIVDTARRAGMRVIGPNTSGVLNPHIGLNLVGVESIAAGAVAILSQSGNIGLDLMTSMAASGVGLSLYVGVGNESDIAFHEYLEYLHTDDTTRAILIYCEGFRDPGSFFVVVERVNRTKPVVILKGGRSGGGGRAALSHTGAIAGSYEVFRALADQRGVMVIDRSDELLAVGQTLGLQPPVAPSTGVAVIADGGGHATLAVDYLTESGVSLARFEPGLHRRLSEMLGPAAATDNPVDLAGAADRDLAVFGDVAEAVFAEAGVGGVLLSGLFGGYALRFDESLAEAELLAAGRLATAARRAEKPLVLHTLYASRATPPLQLLRGAGVPVVQSLDSAARCVSASVERGRLLAARVDPAPPPPRPAPIHEVIVAARAEGRAVLTEWETRALLSAHGVPIVPATLCRSAGEAWTAAARISGPVVLKLLSRTIVHRTEAGGVELGLEGRDKVRDAYERIRVATARYAEAHQIEADFRGVLVAPLIDRPAVELLVACRYDPQYGPFLVLGVGGVIVEAAKDHAIAGLPLRSDDVDRLLRSLRVAPLLFGYRGRPGVETSAIRDMCARLANLLLAHQELSEIELNPVFPTPDGAVAVDGLAVLRSAGAEAGTRLA